MRSVTWKVAAGTIVVACVVALAIFAPGQDCSPVAGTGALRLDVTRLRPGHAKTYCYTDEAGRRLRFVLARGGDGTIRSVFDACRQCFVYHRGYEIALNELVCRVCGNHYPIERMTAGKASCVPATLAHEAAGGSVKIKVSDLKAGADLF